MSWQLISEHKPKHSMHQILCGHSEKKWIRFGFYETILKRWYYSGTNERSQWAQVEGDTPTHFMPLPSPPEIVEDGAQAAADGPAPDVTENSTTTREVEPFNGAANV